MLEKFENAALFLLLGLPSTLIRHGNEGFKPEEFENAGFYVRVDEKLETGGAFRKRWLHDNYAINPGINIFLPEFSRKLTNPNMTGGCCVFKFLPRSVDGKHLMRFQTKPSVFKVLWSSEDGA